MPRSSTLLKILDDTQTLVQGLGLAGINPESVIVLKVAINSTAELPPDKYPAVLIAPWQSKGIDKGAGTNARRDVVYPVVIVTIEDPAEQSPLGIDDLDTDASWIEQITNVFDQNPHTYPLPTAATVFNGTVAPMATVEPDSLLANTLTVCGIVVNFTSRESRAAYANAPH